MFQKFLKDRFYLFKKLTVDVFNSRFGNAAGDVILRKGRLYLNDQAISLLKKVYAHLISFLRKHHLS